MKVPPGGRIGPFEVVRELARGGQGVVYVARHPSGGEVALKLLLDDDPEVRQRFLREARTLARLQHPNLIRLVEAGELPGGVAFLAMELVVGHDLERELREQGPLAPERAAELLTTLAEALHYCHEQGVVHRDLKPGNLLVEQASGRVVLVDFGLVRRRRLELAWSTQDLDSLTQEGHVLGTPGYMAPEQISPEWGEVDRRADVYALGATLFALLTGLAPFRGALLSVLDAVLNQAAPDPRSLRPGLPKELCELCLRCLEKDPDLRPRDAAEVARALQAPLAPGTSPRLPLALGVLAGGALLVGLALGQGGSAADSPRPPAASVASGDPLPTPSAPREPSNRPPLPSPSPSSSPSPSPSSSPSPSPSPNPSASSGPAQLLRNPRQGDPEADRRRADQLVRGGKQADLPEAVALYRRAAAAGDAKAMHSLGALYGRGLGVPRDRREQERWVAKASQAGDPLAMVSYSSLLSARGRMKEARSWLERAHALGNRAASIALGQLLETGQGGDVDRARARAIYRECAQRGFAPGMASLGRSLLLEGGEEREEGRRWLERAYELKSVEAGFRLGLLALEEGRRAEGLRLIEAAEQTGMNQARVKLADLLLEGELLEADTKRAMRLYREAAEAGSSAGLFRLGECYYTGKGGERDTTQGERFVRSAAKRDYGPAAAFLAQILLKREDFAGAKTWGRTAAERGVLTGMVAYATALCAGEDPQPREALKWLRRAAQGGSPDGMVDFARLVVRLDAREAFPQARAYVEQARAHVDALPPAMQERARAELRELRAALGR